MCAYRGCTRPVPIAAAADHWPLPGSNISLLESVSVLVLKDALKQPDIRDKLAATGIEPMATTADQFSSLMKADIARWQKVVEKSPQLRSDE